MEKNTFSHQYIKYRKLLFPSMLKSPDVTEQDEKIIREKILTKPIRPYILRHTSLTEKGPVIGDYNLRLHADWTMTSNMARRYLHFNSTQSVRALEKAQGIISDKQSGASGGSSASDIGALRPLITCNNCREPNKPDAKFCSNPNCRVVLDWKADNEIQKEAKQKAKEFEEMKEKVDRLTEAIRLLDTTNDTILRVERFQKRMLIEENPDGEWSQII